MKVTINEGTSFLITDEIGDVTSGTKQGLYSEDTRFLSRYHLTLEGKKPTLLSTRKISHYNAVHYLTNPPLTSAPSDTLSIKRTRFVGQGLHDDLDIINHNQNPISLSVEFQFDSDFADIFEIKTESLVKTGVYLMEFGEDKKSLIFNYSRRKFIRKLMVNFSKKSRFKADQALFKIKLGPQEKWHLCLNFMPLITEAKILPTYSCKKKTAAPEEILEKKWLAQAPQLTTDYDSLAEAYRQSLVDLEALLIHQDALSPVRNSILAAGLPWFMTFFGRDNLITAYQTLLVNPELSKATLKLLAKYQGKKIDLRTAEEPGKILHEIRFGELSRFKEIPQTPYYGTIDATPLFLILLSETYRFTGDIGLVKELKKPALKALEWIDNFGDLDGDGYLEYHHKAGKGLANQGWKDSGEAIQFANGKLAESPIALVEVQGYVYDAKKRMAELFEILKDKKRAKRLSKEADELKKRFNKDFWMENKAYFSLGLDNDKRKIDAVTSNPGHLLWSGIVDEDKAWALAKKLLSPELFSGWGIRTMSTKNKGYNPLSYHNGSVWPHDNSLIIAGLARYGFYEEARRLIEALLEAASYFPSFRLPELFCGYAKGESGFPVEYPAASSPQAWASGALFLILTTILGIKVAPDLKKIWLKPTLPKTVNHLKLTSIKVGDSLLSLGLSREDTQVKTFILKAPKNFEVIVDSAESRRKTED